MIIFRIFSYLNILFFLGLTMINPAFSETEKQINPIKTDNFSYTHTFYRENKTQTDDLTSDIKQEPVTQTLPGEELIAVTDYTYINRKPTNKSVFTLHLPKETIYVEGSATDGKNVWFSTDNGKTWSQYPDIHIIKPDGTKHIATNKDITHLQWRMPHPLKKGDTGTLKYKVIIQ